MQLPCVHCCQSLQVFVMCKIARGRYRTALHAKNARLYIFMAKISATEKEARLFG
jgi:hypothetical protein